MSAYFCLLLLRKLSSPSKCVTKCESLHWTGPIFFQAFESSPNPLSKHLNHKAWCFQVTAQEERASVSPPSAASKLASWADVIKAFWGRGYSLLGCMSTTFWVLIESCTCGNPGRWMKEKKGNGNEGRRYHKRQRGDSFPEEHLNFSQNIKRYRRVP